MLSQAIIIIIVVVVVEVVEVVVIVVVVVVLVAVVVVVVLYLKTIKIPISFATVLHNISVHEKNYLQTCCKQYIDKVITAI